MFRVKNPITSTAVGITFEVESGNVETIDHSMLKSWDVYYGL